MPLGAFVKLRSFLPVISAVTPIDGFSTAVWNRLARLRAPFLWPSSRRPTLVEVTVAIQWVQDQIAVGELKLKIKRIQAWKQKIQDSAKIGSAFLFHHLKNKVSTEPANLVIDQQGNAIFDPQSA